MYAAGRGVARNEAAAAALFQKAAEAGNALAQFRFAACLENGIGVAKNDAEAAKYHNKATEQGLKRVKRRWSLSDSKVSAAGESMVPSNGRLPEARIDDDKGASSASAPSSPGSSWICWRCGGPVTRTFQQQWRSTEGMVEWFACPIACNQAPG